MKLKTCTINNGQAAQVSRNQKQSFYIHEQSRLIDIISQQSNRYGDKLLDFMDTYGLDNLQSATVKQLREYVATHCQPEQENTLEVLK